MSLQFTSPSKGRFVAILLVSPLVVFIAVTFVLPLTSMVKESVYDAEVADALPKTLKLLADWSEEALPNDEIYSTIAEEMVALQESRNIGKVAVRVNRVVPGTRSAWGKSARGLARSDDPDIKQLLITLDDRWADIELWRGIKTAGNRFTARNYLQAVDLTRGDDGNIVRVEEERRAYGSLYLRTLYVAVTVTLLCVVLGYPMAHAIAHAPPVVSKLLLILVLVPFWTSLLARTTSWIALLQSQGVINDILVWIGLVDDANRLSLIYNMFGTLVAMTQVLLPFMVLPIYAVLNSIPPVYMRAAASLGANPFQAFFKVYWPQSLPGVYAGGLLVFILALGYYITPAIVGGTKGQLISNMIAYHINNNNWGLGAAISVIVLISVMVLYLVFDRWIGVEKLKLS